MSVGDRDARPTSRPAVTASVVDLEDEPLPDPGGMELTPAELGALRLGRARGGTAGGSPRVGRAAAAEREGEREQGEGSAHPANLRS